MILSSGRLCSRGFTLLEILISLAILTTVLSIIFKTYTGTSRVVEETEFQAETYGMARIALERIIDDLESAHMAVHEDLAGREHHITVQTPFLGENKKMNGQDADTLRFFSRSFLGLNQVDECFGLSEIRYFAREDRSGKTITLYRSETPEYIKSSAQPSDGLVLCEGLISIDFTYYDSNEEAFDSWDSRSERFINRLPSGVFVTLVFPGFSDDDAPLRFITGISVPMGRIKHDQTL